MKLTEGLHRIGNDIVACYLVATDDGVTVIDAGLAGQWPQFLRELAAAGRNLSEVRAVILTHGDEDHLGFAERLRRDHGVPVFVHEQDAQRAQGAAKPAAEWGRMRVLPLLRFLGYAAARGGLKTTFLTEVQTFTAGQTLAVPGHPTVIGLPGHSPGSVGFLFPSQRALFVGDALTTRHVLTGAEGPAPAPFTDDPAQARASLGELSRIDADWVLPGHGPVWRDGVSEALERYGQVAQ